MSGDLTDRFGKYELLGQIGHGGMAEIYKARAVGPDGFEKILVVKKILPAFAKDPNFIEMLVAEARLTAMLQHTNIVQIYEFDKVGDQYYIAMEYVHGADLLKVLTRCTQNGVRIPLEITLFMIAQLCKGLAHAHTATDSHGRPLKIIHRDVSPSNVLISFDGEVKVLDFGVARVDLEGSGPAKPGGLKGKYGYMAPEQVTTGTIDHRADVFAVGTVLFETLTLKRLFLGKSDLDTLRRVREVRIDKKFARHNYIPDEVQTIMRRALARDPDERYATASDLEEALMDYLFEQRFRVTDRKVGEFLSSLFPVDSAQTTAGVAPPLTSNGSKPGQRQSHPALPPEAPERGPDTKAGHKGTDGKGLESVLGSGNISDPAVLPAKQVPPPPKQVAPPAQAPEAPMSHLARATFRLRSEDGYTFGPITFNNLVSLLRSRSITGGEQVSVDGNEWTAVGDLQAIRQLEPTLFEDEPEDPLYEGPVSRVYTPQMFYRLFTSKVSGKLRLTRRSTMKEVYLDKGRPVFVTSNLKGELLGAFMLRTGRANHTQLQDAVKNAKAHRSKLGDALVRIGVLRSHDLYQVLEAQFRMKLLEIFGWDDGWYQFYEGHIPADDIVWMPQDTAQLIAAGVRERYDLELMRRTFDGYLDRVIVLQRNALLSHANLRMSSRELRFHTYLETGRTLRELVARFGRTAEDQKTLLQVVFVLHQTDLLTFRIAQTAHA